MQFSWSCIEIYGENRKKQNRWVFESNGSKNWKPLLIPVFNIYEICLLLQMLSLLKEREISLPPT